MTINDFKDFGDECLADIKEYVKNYIDTIDQQFDNNNGLFFYGSNGVGKSMLSSIILKQAYIHRYSGRRVTFGKYISLYTESWGSKNKEVIEENFSDQYKSVEFLVLEEVGKEIDSKIAKPILEDLLRYREENGLVTIMCSNISLQIIQKDYGNSITSLIKGNMTPIKIIGADRR